MRKMQENINYSVQEKYSSVDICNTPRLENQVSKSSENAAQSGVLYQIHVMYKKVIATLAKCLSVSVAFFHVHMSNKANDFRRARFQLNSMRCAMYHATSLCTLSWLFKICETLHLYTEFILILGIEDKSICPTLCRWTHCTFKQLEDKRSVAKYLFRCTLSGWTGL